MAISKHSLWAIESWKSRRLKWPEKFWRRVKIKKPDECWPFLGTKGAYGHGKLRFNNICTASARVAWILTFGDPGKQWVLHTCDNGSCCNPKHLYLGNQSDNMRDAVERKRFPNRKGELHPLAKLTDAQVKQIKTMYRPRVYTKRMIALRFNVAINTIKDIVEGRHWKHI